MRLLIAVAAVLVMLAGIGTVPLPVLNAASGYSVVAAQQQQPSPKAQVDINVHRSGGAWWTSPTWIAIGAVVLLLVIVIVALAARGGGTTIVRD
jgi:hypothetical protein